MNNGLKLISRIVSEISLLFTVLSFLAITAKADNKPASGPAQPTAFEERIRQLGLDNIVNDYSEAKKIVVDEPPCAYINITGTDKMPSKKGKQVNVWMEVYLGNGNYFRKRAIIGAQGNSSLNLEKINFKVDFCNDEWLGNVTPNITIGDWVKQDSYHFKAYYIDWLRGVGVVGYRLYDQMAINTGRPWKRAADHIDNPKENARCYPDGFPSIVYLNGEFYGIYAWQLKKHRANMNQDKAVAEHIHLDGELDDDGFWCTDSIQWGRFEVRNPKALCTMDGGEYGEDNLSELMDETSPCYVADGDDDEEADGMRRTVQVKKHILGLSSLCPQMERMEGAGADEETLRRFFEQHFDITSLVDYACFHYVANNFDGFTKNWQWFTYDGDKWFVAPYDLDCIMGNFFTGVLTIPADQNAPGEPYTLLSHEGPFRWIDKLYSQRIRDRYCELRDAGIFSLANIDALLEDWYYRVGDDNYTREWAKWPDSKCISEVVPSEGWKQAEYTHYWQTDPYDEEKTYHPGDRCRLDRYVWEATETVCGVKPYVTIGYTDSLQRYEDWVAQRINLMDLHFGYTQSIKGDVNGDGAVDVADIAAVISAMAGVGAASEVGADPVPASTADVNGDGAVDVADIAAIISIMSLSFAPAQMTVCAYANDRAR